LREEAESVNQSNRLFSFHNMTDKKSSSQKQELRPNTKEQMLKRFKENLSTFKKTFDYLKDK